MTEEEQFEQRAIAEFTRPWGTRRGIEPSDGGHDVIAVRAPVQDVSAAYARRGFTVVPDAVDKTVTIGRWIGFVVRLKGHAWTMVLEGDTTSNAKPPTPIELSKDIGAPVLQFASYEDGIAYSYFEAGALVEQMEGNGGDVVKFESRKRARADLARVPPAAIANAFVTDHDAYVSDIGASYFFGDGRTRPELVIGAKLRVANPGFVLMVGRGREVVSRPEIEKIDYLVLPP